ncbi:TonB-dependent receptor [Catenovulum sp. SM1970]|uniref:TonB-dependent receptor n=1 Tax=Marinifaba aquimaris TaxID=2741323 RepID=UPI001572DC5D|nr:TonB-dependent receptor [Marinifaba aquimaris]NTS76610.1 TonB-dependent receptor [Marinifaba aquimaris]
MSSLKLNKITHAMSLAALMGATVSAPVAFAAEAAAEEEVEVIQVRGIRGSLKESMNTKRFSTGTVDAVNAEDVGKFPDANVAESLARIPGVSVSRTFGEGSAVSIRGASNGLTLTTLNGQNVASAGWYSQQAIDRTFNYSMLAPEMIAGIEVYKSSQADLLEGGVGGTVIVKTRKPLDLDPLTVFASAKGTYGSVSEETDPSVSGLVSWKNEDETFGVLLALGSNEYNLDRKGDESLISWGGRIAPTSFQQERNRTSIDFTAQYAPTDDLEFGFHYMNMELEADGTNVQVWIPQDQSNCSEFIDQPNSQHFDGMIPVNCTSTTEWASNAGAGGQPYWDVRPRLATMETELFAFDFTYKADGATFEFQAGLSDAEGGTNFETNHAYLTPFSGSVGVTDQTQTPVHFSDQRNGDFSLPSAGEYFGWEGLQTSQVVSQPRTDEERYFQTDVTFDVDLGAITSIKTGFRWSNHEIAQNAFRGVFDGFDGAADALIHDGSEFQSGMVEAGNGFMIPQANSARILAHTREHLTGFGEERSGVGSLQEETIASYIMANFESEGFRGNFGFRFIDTKATGKAFAIDPDFVDPEYSFNNTYTNETVTETYSYNEILPSLNIAYDLSDDLILRFGAASVIARPNYNDMFTNSALVGYGDNIEGNEGVIKGSVGLNPFKAFQSDLGVEWYYSEDSMVAAALFAKSIQTFTTSSAQAGQAIGIIDPDTGADSWNVESYEDGEGGDIIGLEFQLQHAFDNGFGTVINYTYADSEAEDKTNFADHNPELSDTSEHTVNLVGYYENDDFSARAAYSWRSEYMIRETGFYGAREHQDFGTLDLSASYNLTENITLTADAVNVTEEDSEQMGNDAVSASNQARFAKGVPNAVYYGEARYSVGVQFRF